MRYFILGHQGFVGKHLTSKLIQEGHDVITDWRYWDEKYDAFINLAAVTHISKTFDPELIKSNIILVDKVFKRSGRIIQASSCSAKHDTNPYAQAKMWAEYLVQRHNDAIALRFHNIYGPGGTRGIVWHLMNLSDGAKLDVRGPDLIRDYVWVHDVVDDIVGHLSGLRTTGIWDVGTGTPTSTMDLVNLFQKLSGREFDISVSEPGDNEPAYMVSDLQCCDTDLKTGLEKMINS